MLMSLQIYIKALNNLVSPNKIIEVRQNKLFMNKTVDRTYMTKNCLRNKYLRNSCENNKIDSNR